MQRWLTCCLIFLILAQCKAGPDYIKPDATKTATFKELPDLLKTFEGWKKAHPRDTEPRGTWWAQYQDPQLNQLMDKVHRHNQNLRAAEAQYRQALTLISSARASLFPVMTFNTSQMRGLGLSTADPQLLSQAMNASLNVSWAPDFWGQVRRTIESNTASAQASLADLENAKLSIQTTLAQTYFQLRITDMQKRLYDQTVEAYQKSLAILRNQYRAGIVQRTDVDQAETILASTQALSLDVDITRRVLEHAIAVLIGAEPAQVSIAPHALSPQLFPVPVCLPAELLERRPDVASAERRMAAANAKIGIAEAAFFPAVTLSSSAGYQHNAWGHLTSWPNRFWSLGPSLALNLFDGGSRTAAKNQAIAVYDQAVAVYRQTVLAAFQNVEDQLATLKFLDEELKAQDQAVSQAQDMVVKIHHQYNAGVVSLLNVINAQTNAFSQERTRLTLLNRRFSAHVGLIAALGGCWTQ